jgi:DNA polymerase I-like protein with 3'-5' exonuclease and polymerase domains
MFSCEKRGLNVIATIHDEIICLERDEDAEEASKKLTEVMNEVPPAFNGLPLAAKADIHQFWAK